MALDCYGCPSCGSKTASLPPSRLRLVLQALAPPRPLEYTWLAVGVSLGLLPDPWFWPVWAVYALFTPSQMWRRS